MVLPARLAQHPVMKHGLPGLEATVRHLRIQIDDALEISDRAET